MTKEKFTLIGSLLREKHFEEGDVQIFFKRHRHVYLGRFEEVPDEAADRLIASLKRSPVKEVLEERESLRVTDALRREDLAEYAQGRGIETRDEYGDLNEDELCKRLYRSGIDVPRRFFACDKPESRRLTV
jgi:hypothetical protein